MSYSSIPFKINKLSLGFRFLMLLLFLGGGVQAQKFLVADVKIQGAKKTKPYSIQRLSSVKAGARVDSTALEADIIRIKRLPSVAHAYYQVYPAQGESYNVFYNIEENFTIIPYASVYTTNNDEFAFRVGIQEFNFLGYNVTLGGFFQHDVFDSYGANIRAPYLFSSKLGLQFSYQNLTTQEPVFLDSGASEYRYNNESFELLGLYELNAKHAFEAGVNLFTEDYQFLFGATDPNVPQELNVDKFLYKVLYNYNNVDSFFQYLYGFKSSFNAQYVTSTNETLPEFIIVFNDFSYFRRSGKRGNWASRVRLGIATNNDSPFAPFAVDNNLNIRGVGNTIDRGTAMIVLNTEYRYSFVDKDWFVLQGNAFVDGGTWRNPGGEFSDFGDDQNLRIYPGLGLRFIHKRIFNAIFRIDYGVGVTPGATQGVVFGIGQYF